MPPIFFEARMKRKLFSWWSTRLQKTSIAYLTWLLLYEKEQLSQARVYHPGISHFIRGSNVTKREYCQGVFLPFLARKCSYFSRQIGFCLHFGKSVQQWIGSPKENINMLSLSLTILSIWDTDATYYNLWLFLFRDISVAFFGLDWNNSFKLLDKFAKCMDEMRSEPTSSLWTLVLPQHLLHDLLQLESDLEAHQEAVLKGRTNREEKEHIR